MSGLLYVEFILYQYTVKQNMSSLVILEDDAPSTNVILEDEGEDDIVIAPTVQRPIRVPRRTHTMHTHNPSPSPRKNASSSGAHSSHLLHHPLVHVRSDRIGKGEPVPVPVPVGDVADNNPRKLGAVRDHCGSEEVVAASIVPDRVHSGSNRCKLRNEHLV